MDDLQNRFDEMEAMLVVLQKKIYKLEKRGSRMAPDSSWLADLKKEAAKIKL